MYYITLVVIRVGPHLFYSPQEKNGRNIVPIFKNLNVPCFAQQNVSEGYCKTVPNRNLKRQRAVVPMFVPSVQTNSSTLDMWQCLKTFFGWHDWGACELYLLSENQVCSKYSTTLAPPALGQQKATQPKYE